MKYDEVSAKAGSGKKKGASDYKKGAAETVKQEKKDLKKDMEGGMKNAGDVPGKKGGAKHHGNMPPKKGSGDHKDGHKGGAKYKKGAGDYDVKKGSHDHPHSGPGRMGYTQNFGPARQNSYAKGAAKVAKIMGYPGAGDHIDGHPAEEIKLNDVTPSGGVKTNNAKDDLRNIIKSQSEYDKNTTSVSRELAEKDSLKLVIKGQGQKAHELYGRYGEGDKGSAYTSSTPIPINPYNKSATNQHVLARIANKKRLREEAKKIQGPRPSLD